MNKTPATPKIVVILGLVLKAGIPALIVRATAIVNAMQGYPKIFVSPVPSFAQVLADLTALTDAQTAYKSHLGTKTARDDKANIVVADMNQYHGYVQQLANASPAQAENIVDAAAMKLRKGSSRHKPDLSVKQTVSGAVHLVAKATKGAKANLWQYSTDGGKNWIDVPPTSKATTAILGLTPGTTVSFRQRVLTKTGLADWSQDVSHLVS
jgi:hypothetical protein